MPTTVERLKPNQKSEVLCILPGKLNLVPKFAKGVLCNEVLLICCDLNDRTTDVFTYDTSEDEDQEFVDVDHAIENGVQIASIGHGETFTIDLRDDDTGEVADQMIVGHAYVMGPN